MSGRERMRAAATVAAPTTGDTTFGDRLDTVENIVGGTGDGVAAELAVGGAVAGTAIVR